MIRYAVVSAVTWVLALESMPFVSEVTADDVLGPMAVSGIPSLVISVGYSLCRTRTGSRFRGPLAALLVLPLWFVLFVPPMLPFALAGQLVFALGVIRAPLLGPPSLRPLARRLCRATP
ncbi:hypothetical protein ACFZDG_12480 [Kitasatospora xanthocidica]|uniref:hypothetical protein n=1 Tax=Kitasatospora xanthocidica TaxID=83382 RepID=UPI0036F0B397